MALLLERRRTPPHDGHAHPLLPFPPAAGASTLEVVSRQHRAIVGPALQPFSAYSVAPGFGLGLSDVDPSSVPFMPGCCVLSARPLALVLVPFASLPP